MDNKVFLSITIPTYNRADFLNNLLSSLLPQVKGFEGKIEICVSDNNSTDNTAKIVADFEKKYPGLINYNKNEKNIGAERNFLKLMEICVGKFIWLIGDDDTVAERGLKKVVNSIENYCNENTGLVSLGIKSYFIDNQTGKEIVYCDTVEKGKSKVYQISREDVIGRNFPYHSFISVLIFNSSFLKKILRVEKLLVEKATKSGYLQVFLYQLMFLKYPELQALRFNEEIIGEDLHYYRFYIEDKFWLHYTAQIKLRELLLSSGYANDYYKKIIIKRDEKLFKLMVIEMGVMKAFKTFNYSSFSGCFKMFFRQAPLKDALLFSVFFMIFFITPSFLCRVLYKAFIKIRFKKKWRQTWLFIVVCNSKMSIGSQRMMVS